MTSSFGIVLHAYDPWRRYDSQRERASTGGGRRDMRREAKEGLSGVISASG